MSRYVGLEIAEVRQISKQETSDEDSQTEAVSRNLILSFLSQADERIQSLMMSNPSNTFFNTTNIITTVAEDKDYALPGDLYAGDLVKLVEYSYSGESKHYVPLRRILRSQVNNTPGQRVCNFLTEGSNLILSPPPLTAGQLVRVTYPKIVDRLDVRRGQVSSTPVNDGTDYSALTLDDDAFLSASFFDDHNFLCVSDRNGVVQRYNLEYESYDSATRTFTLSSGQAISSGTISAGDFVTLGKYSTTHSPMPRIVERYRIAYAAWKVMRVVSNTDAKAQQEEVVGLENDIVSKLKDTMVGVVSLPMTGLYA